MKISIYSGERKMKIRIYSGESYPVYSWMESDKDENGLEVSSEQIARWNIIQQNYETMQDELESLEREIINAKIKSQQMP